MTDYYVFNWEGGIVSFTSFLPPKNVLHDFCDGTYVFNISKIQFFTFMTFYNIFATVLDRILWTIYDNLWTDPSTFFLLPDSWPCRSFYIYSYTPVL